jgi:phage terminase large subunit
MIAKAIESPKERYRASYIAPFRSQGKDIAWEYLKHYSRPLWSRPPSEAELFVELINGARLKIYGADNPEALRGGYLDNVVLDEYPDMAPSIWGSIIRPQLADRSGSATFIGTPKGRNSFFEMFQYAKTDAEWFTFALPAHETHVLDEQELAAAARDMTPEQYAQEFENSFDAAITGSYYGKDITELEARGHFIDVEVVRSCPVHTAWDLGISDSTSIWFWQAVRQEVHVVDYYENNSQNLAHYASVLAAKGYSYGNDYVPHDAKVRELGTGRTRVETLAQLGRRPVLVPDHKKPDGINAARLMLPKTWFDTMKTRDAVEALRQYRRNFDEKKRAYSDDARHDWTSHCADAFRYMAMAYKAMRTVSEKNVVPLYLPLGDLSYNQFFKAAKVRRHGRL